MMYAFISASGVNPLSLISTIVDMCKFLDEPWGVNPLSLISTIVYCMMANREGEKLILYGNLSLHQCS